MCSVLAAVSASSSAILRAAAAAASSFSARTPSSSATRASLCAARASVSARRVPLPQLVLQPRRLALAVGELLQHAAGLATEPARRPRARRVLLVQVLRPLALVLAGEGRVVEPRLERGPLLLERRLPRLHAASFSSSRRSAAAARPRASSFASYGATCLLLGSPSSPPA